MFFQPLEIGATLGSPGLKRQELALGMIRVRSVAWSLAPGALLCPQLPQRVCPYPFFPPLSSTFAKSAQLTTLMSLNFTTSSLFLLGPVLI